MMNEILANNWLLEQLPADVEEQVKDIMARILKLAGYKTAELEHGFEFHWGHSKSASSDKNFIKTAKPL